MFGMAWLLMAALVVVGTDAQLPSDCGDRFDQNLEQTIVVSEAKRHSWPWQLSLRKSSRHVCGASIISEDYVITSAGCVRGAPASSIELHAGLHELATYGSNLQVSGVSRMWIHENYNPKTFDNDIALLRLDYPFELGGNIIPVCLPSGEITTPGTQMWATGWGNDPYLGISTPLRQVMLPFVDRSTCQRKYYGFNITDGMICAGNKAVDKKKVGEAGGPLVSRRSDKRWVQNGISSTFIQSTFPHDRSNLFTNVNVYKFWILEKIKQVAAEEELVSQRSFRPIPAGVAFRTMRGKVTEDESPENDVDIVPVQE